MSGKRINLFLFLGLFTILFVTATNSWAAENQTTSENAPAAYRAPAAKAQDNPDNEDEYDFSWLDPDKKVYVLQNRKYRKARRLAAFLQGGMNVSDPFKTGYIGSLRAAFWFTEQWGVEAFYNHVANSDSTTLTALKRMNATALPFVREVQSYFGGVATWTPFYAKINVFNHILYFDWFLHLGAGQVSTANDRNRDSNKAPVFEYENFFSLFYGTGQNFFINRHLSVRFDLIGQTYSARGADDLTRRFYHYDVLLGVGYLF